MLGQDLVETLHRAFLAGGDRVGHVPMGKQMLGQKYIEVGAGPSVQNMLAPLPLYGIDGHSNIYNSTQGQNSWLLNKIFLNSAWSDGLGSQVLVSQQKHVCSTLIFPGSILNRPSSTPNIPDKFITQTTDSVSLVHLWVQLCPRVFVGSLPRTILVDFIEAWQRCFLGPLGYATMPLCLLHFWVGL